MVKAQSVQCTYETVEDFATEELCQKYCRKSIQLKFLSRDSAKHKSLTKRDFLESISIVLCSSSLLVPADLTKSAWGSRR